MQTTNILETVLWGVAATVAAGMIIVLTLGLFKGVFWEQQLKARRRQL